MEVEFLKLDGKVAIVTGAGREGKGIGRSIALALAAERTPPASGDAWQALIFTVASRAAIPALAERGGGAITCVSSIAALRGHQRTAYAAAKAGVIGLVVTLAEQLGPKGIRVNAIAPGQVWTPMVAYHGERGREERRRGQVPPKEGA